MLETEVSQVKQEEPPSTDGSVTALEGYLSRILSQSRYNIRFPNHEPWEKLSKNRKKILNAKSYNLTDI